MTRALTVFAFGAALALAALVIARRLVPLLPDSSAPSGAAESLLSFSYAVESAFMPGRFVTSIAGIDAIKAHEALSLTPYRDQADKWTIGYGHLLKGAEWWDSISEEQARELLAADLRAAENAVNALVSMPLRQSQFDALVSLVFNIGAGAFTASTLLKLINAGDLDAATDQFPRWNKVTLDGHKVESEGLSFRRAKEARLFATGVYV
jgi:lysozyme